MPWRFKKMIQKLKEQNVLASKEITFGDSDDIKMY